MILYNSNFLEKTDIFSQDELNALDRMQKNMSLEYFLNSSTLNTKFGFDFIYSSAQIEGNTYTKAETLSLLEAGITAGGKKYSDAIMILNLRNAYDTIISNDIELNKSNLHNIHSIIAKDLVQNTNLGTMRKSNIDGISGSSYLPLASGEKLNEELNYLLKKAIEIENPFNKALYIHNNIAYLQYFEDCNKRTARTMQFISLKNDGIMPLILLNEDRNDYAFYRETLLEYYEKGDYKSYKSFFMRHYLKMNDFFNALKDNLSTSDKRKKLR